MSAVIFAVIYIGESFDSESCGILVLGNIYIDMILYSTFFIVVQKQQIEVELLLLCGAPVVNY